MSSKSYLGITFICAALALLSCSTGERSSANFDLNSKNYVSIDSVSADCLLSVWSMAVVGDTLVLANNNNDAFFETYELPSLRHIASGCRNGNGPGELANPALLTMKPYIGNCVMINGLSGLSFDIIDIDSLRKVDDIQWQLPEDWGYTQDYAFIDSEIIAAERGESPHNWAIFDTDGKITHEFPLNIPDDIKAQAIDDFTKMAFDTSWGAGSSEHRTLAIGYRSFPVVEYYDFNGELKAKIEAPYTAGEKLQCWLIRMQSTKDHIYLLYNNLTPEATSTGTIVKTDWNGNIEATYALLRPVPIFAPDEKNNKIYFRTPSEAEEDYIYFFNM